MLLLNKFQEMVFDYGDEFRNELVIVKDINDGKIMYKGKANDINRTILYYNLVMIGSLKNITVYGIDKKAGIQVEM